MIPYFISLLLLGIPLMWIEWSIGRYGGIFGHGTGPGVFHSLWRNRFIKYFGIIGIFGPLVIFIYYTYIESWLLGYAFFSLTPKFNAAAKAGEMSQFLAGYQGVEKNQYFSSIWWAYSFFVITFLLNLAVIKKGISKGIEKLSKIAMPILILLAVLVAIRVITLGAPNSANPDWSIWNGFGYLWNPDFSALLSAKVWLAAAGQIFFTLSVGIGVILTYASYLKKEDDVVLSGLTSVSINEFCEVILGASIIIPAAYVFFGPQQIQTIAASGAFNLSFVTMPSIFAHISLGQIFAFLWFGLLFLAGITSSVSLAQPAIAFMEDEFNISRKKAVNYLGLVTFILCQPAIFFLSKGVVGELDFWGGTFGLVLFGTIETILFVWVFGIDKAWKEMHQGSALRIPIVFKYIMKYITPVVLLTILVSWSVQDALPLLLMKGVPAENMPYILGTRLLLVSLLGALIVLVKIAWKHKKYAKEVKII
jgi:SNF family Na+-dependent transporter